jgi:hypothetical protein
MAVTPQRARDLALALEGASEARHVDRVAFRTPKRIFATMAANGADLNFMFDPAQQEFYCEQAPRAFAPVQGGWGKMGITRCDLKQVEAGTFRGALAAAHARAMAPRPKRKR